MSTKTIISQLALRHGISEKQLEKDMLDAINAGLNSDDVSVRALWREILPDGQAPSVEAVLDFCISKIAAQI